MSEEEIENVIKEIERLNKVQTPEEKNFDNGYRKALYDSYYLYEKLNKEIERLNKTILTLEETIRKANNNVIKDIAMIKTHEMVKQEIVQRLIETSKILENGSDKE